MKKIPLFASLLFSLLIIAGCLVENHPSFTKAGIARDTIFSVENRGSGLLVIWLTHDESGAYCLPQTNDDPSAESLIEHEGEVIIYYRSADYSGTNCIRAESSPTYTVYLATSIRMVKAR